MSQDFRQMQNDGSRQYPQQNIYQSNSQKPPIPTYGKEGNNLPLIKVNVIEGNSEREGLIQLKDGNEFDNLLNQLNSQTGLKINDQKKGRNSLSPHIQKDIVCEEDRFTFEKMEKEMQNREKVDSYHSATFRKGSELNQITLQNSLPNSQNDLSLNNSQAGGRPVYQRKSTGKQSIDQTSLIVQPYIKINNRAITSKQFLSQIKESVQYDYPQILLGICKFAEMYQIIESKKKQQNINQIAQDALFLYENKFKGIKPSKSYDFKPDFDMFYHNITQKFLYQKSSSFGRTVERQACICEGKIKQPIPDKENKNREYQNTILQPYKEKIVTKVLTRIEQKGGANNFTQLKWVTNPLKKYRVLYQDSKKSYLAVYTETKEEAVKLRDYSICFNIEDQEKTFTPMGIFRYITIILPRLRVVQQFKEKLKIYAEYVKAQQSKIIHEVSMEESPQQKHPSISFHGNQLIGSQGEIKSNFQLIQLEHLKIEEDNEKKNGKKESEEKQIAANLIQKYGNNQYASNNKESVNQKMSNQSIKGDQINQSNQNIQPNQDNPQNNNVFNSNSNSNKLGQDQKQQHDSQNPYKSVKKVNNVDYMGDSAEKDMILEDEEEENNIQKTKVNESVGNQKRGSNIQIQSQNQSINSNTIFNSSKQQNNNFQSNNDNKSQSINNLNILIQQDNNSNLHTQQNNKNNPFQSDNFNNSNNYQSNNNNNNTFKQNDVIHSQNNNFNNNYQNKNSNNSNNNNNNSINNNANNSYQNNNNNSNNTMNNNKQKYEQDSNNNNTLNQYGQPYQQRGSGPPPQISKWNQQDSKIYTFKSDMIRDSSKDSSIISRVNLIKEYDQIFLRSFGEQLKMTLRNIADEQITYIKHKVQMMKESADIPVDIFLTFQQIQFEFKNERDQQDMIFKPKLRLQISEENDSKQQAVQFMVELQSRVCSKKGKIKEFELFGEKKIATIQNIKLVRMKRNEIKIEVIDEITDSIIARNIIKMEKILSQTEFMNLQLTIEPVQLLTDKLIIQLHLQTFIQRTDHKKVSQTPDNEFQEEDEDQLSNIFEQNLKAVPSEVPQNIEEYLENTLLKQNYIIDNFYQSYLFLDRFTPSQFSILLELIQQKGINTTSLQLNLRKQSNKLDCYSSIRVCLFKYYMEKQSQHQSLLAKNISGWNSLYDLIVTQADIVEYGNDQHIGNNYLDTSEGYILRDAVEEMKSNDQAGADQYLFQMQSQRGSLTQSQMLNSTSSRRIVTSIFYKRDLWEQDSCQYSFYERMVELTSKGMPNGLRQTLWLELGKVSKYAYIIDELLHTYYFDLAEDTLQNKKSYVYKHLLNKAYSTSLQFSSQNQISEMQEDLKWYKNHSIYMNDQQSQHLTNILYAYCHYVDLQGSKVIYSKYLIPLASKALDYFRSETQDTSEYNLEENVFWLIVCYTNNYAKRYFNTIQMMQTAQQTVLQQNTAQPNSVNKSILVSKLLVQSQISTLPASNPSQNAPHKLANTLNYIPDDIRLDILVFEYYLKEKNEKFVTFLQHLSFGVGIYFAERMLCFFADLFNHELLFRLWDYLFLEGSSKNALKVVYFGMSIMIYFLNKNAGHIMNVCKSRKDVLLYIQLAAKFEVDCDTFLTDTITIYNNFIQKEPNKFPPIKKESDSQQESSTATLAKTTKRIFDSIINVSRNFFNQTLQKHLESIDTAYLQLDMQRYLNQIIFVQSLVNASDDQTKILDLPTLVKTLDELERDLNTRQQQSYQSGQSAVSPHSQLKAHNNNQMKAGHPQVKAADRSFQDLPRTLTPPNTDSNIHGRARSSSQITVNSQINKLPNQQHQRIDNIKPVYNFYSKRPTIQKIYINIHQIQMVEDYNELTIKISVAGFTKSYTASKVSYSQILDCFELNTQNKFIALKQPFGSYQESQQYSQYQLNQMHPQSGQEDVSRMLIEIYENINGISHPLKQTTININHYQPDLITKDYMLLYDFQEFEEPIHSMSPGYINNTTQSYFNQSILNNNTNNNNNKINNQSNYRIPTQQSAYNDNELQYQQNKDNETRNSFKTNQVETKNQLKTNYSSGIEFSVLVATSHGLGESESYKNMLVSKKFQSNSSFSLLGNSQMNVEGASQINNTLLLDKFNFVPEVMHVRKNQQMESKLKAFNQLKGQYQMEIIQNKSLNSIKNNWKQRSALTIDEFRIFAESTGLKVWLEVNLQELLNHFSFEGRICLFDLLLACVLQVEGRYPQKIELIRRIVCLSCPSPSFSNSDDQLESKQKERSTSEYNPLVYLSTINEIYCKNMLYLPLDQHFNALKMNNLPQINKAKYFFDYYSIPTHTSKSTPLIQQSVSARQQYGQINDSSCNFGATQSRLSHSIDLTVFVQSFCAQQLQFKGTLDFLIDSSEFMNALSNHIRQQNNIDNIPGKLQIFYWSKGQLRQLQAQYGYQTLGLANLNYVKQQKTKLSKMDLGQSQQNASIAKTQQIFKLLEFNDTLLNMNFDSDQMQEEEVNDTFAALPLLSYFNSLQNSLYSQKNRNKFNSQAFPKSRQTVYLNINVDDQSKGSFRLISSSYSSQQSFLEEVQYKNKQFKTILEDWSIIKNVSLPISSQSEMQSDHNKVIDMIIDSVPLWMKIDDLARLITYRVMENCINKIEQFSYKNKETFWINFFNEIKNLDLFLNLESVQFLDQQNYYQLDQNLNLQQNIAKKLNYHERVEDLENVCLVFKFRSNYQRPQYLSYFEQPQQYAIFHFKDGGKSWLPCKILGCVFDESQTHLFLVEFRDFQKNIFKRTEGEISVDQDIKIQQLNYEEMDLINDQRNYQIIDDKSINYNIETQYWDMSQYNGQGNLMQTRNTSNLNALNTSYPNLNDQKTKPTQIFNDTSSFFQPTQGDVRFKEDNIQDEYPINKTYENLKTQTDFDSPQKNAFYAQYLQ